MSDYRQETTRSDGRASGHSRREFLKGVGALAISSPFFLDGTVATAAASRTARGGHPESLIRPVRVTSVRGDVKRPDALVQGGTAKLTVAAGSVAPMVIVDYDRIVGGHPVFEITQVSGQPTLEVIYSQALPYLLPDGDGPAPGTPDTTNAAEKDVSFVGIAGGADLSRVERYPIAAPGTVSNRLVQGGQRFQALTLSGSGSVTLRLVGFVPTFRLPTRAHNQGRFACSDPALNEIWALGAYTLDVASLPVGSVPPIFEPTPEGLRVFGNAYSGYQPGLDWTDYTATFEVKIVANEASWLVRGTPPDGIRMVLCAEGDVLPISTPNSLRIYVEFTKQLVANVPLPFPITEGTWYSVRTVVSGMTGAVFVNDRLVAAFAIPAEGGFWGSTAAGWIAFGNAQGAESLVRNLRVVDPDGNVLYQSALRGDVDLDLFCAASNSLPSIVDGATRDRQLFTGDLGIASLNVVYSNFDLKYLAGSIREFAAYQASNGAIATAIPPQANPGRTPGNAFTPGIPDYTIHQVTTTFNYWQYTGDQEFLAENWPVVKRVLAYIDANTNAQGLFAPFGPPQTVTNAHWYGALLAGAALALAAGEPAAAAAYRQRAAALRTAINANLFNPSTGLYGTSTADLGTAPEDGNAYAVWYGVAPPQIVPALLNRLAAALGRPAGPVQASSGSNQIGPFTAGFDLLARFEAGSTPSALDIIRRAWGHMRNGSAYYSGGVWEYVALDGTPGLGSGTSLAHPWSSAPTPAMSKYLLGVRPLSAGYRTWLVEPQPGDLRWAEGAAPTPNGPIEVRWRIVSGELRLVVRSPSGTTGYVGLPDATGAGLTDNGRSTRAAALPAGTPRPGYSYAGPLGAGQHRISTRAS